MERLRKAREGELPNIEKLIRRAEKGMEFKGLPPFSHYYKMGDGLYVYADGARPIGVADISNSLSPLFKTNAAAKTTALLEKIGYSGERNVLFNAFFVDPAFWYRHKGRDFHNGLLSYFGKGSYFALLSRLNKPGLAFFSSLGYSIVDEGADLDFPDKTLILMAKPFRKTGLCSESLF